MITFANVINNINKNIDAPAIADCFYNFGLNQQIARQPGFSEHLHEKINNTVLKIEDDNSCYKINSYMKLYNKSSDFQFGFTQLCLDNWEMLN